MSSLHHHEWPRDISPERVSQHLGWLASQDKGPMLTLLALLALRAMLHSSGPRFTSRGTNVDLACPTRCPLHLTLNLDERLSYMVTLLPSSTHVATSLVARISVVHQSPKPKQHMLGATHARFD